MEVEACKVRLWRLFEQGASELLADSTYAVIVQRDYDLTQRRRHMGVDMRWLKPSRGVYAPILRVARAGARQAAEREQF